MWLQRSRKRSESFRRATDKQAARLLTDAAYATHDPAAEDEIRRLAEEGRQSAGMFGKGRWDEIIRIANLRREKAGV